MGAAPARAARAADRTGHPQRRPSPDGRHSGGDPYVAGRRGQGARKAGSKSEAAFQRGLAARAQWVEQEGQQAVPRGAVVEIMVDGEAEPVPDKLTAEQLATLATLGMETGRAGWVSLSTSWARRA